MAKRRTRLFISVFACAMLFMYGALNCAYADDSSDDANSWRFFHGELVLSDSGASTDNLDTFEEAAADSADGVMACSVEANGNGWPVYNWFDQFNRGYCSGVGAYKGVDVSEWQGKINWAKVKTAGVDFAILRCGYASTYPDKQWHNNVQGCLSSGMPFGVYLYSRATSPEEASKEADFVISQLKSEYLTGADLAFPVYFDMEDSKMVGKNYAAIAQAFFDKLTAAGYPVGTYANLSWWNKRLTSPVFDKYSKWVAAYNASIGLTYAPMSNFSEGNGIWQFSDYGSVPGISGRVDLNYTYMAPVNSDHWIKSESKWWYRYVDGSYPANCWAQIDGQWYHFDASGWMQTGWLWANGAWYYLDPSGAMLTGWLNDGRGVVLPRPRGRRRDGDGRESRPGRRVLLRRVGRDGRGLVRGRRCLALRLPVGRARLGLERGQRLLVLVRRRDLRDARGLAQRRRLLVLARRRRRRQNGNGLAADWWFVVLALRLRSNGYRLVPNRWRVLFL